MKRLVLVVVALGCAGPIVHSVRGADPEALAEPPRVLARAAADYPDLSKMPAHDVEVVMRIGVDATGVVRNVKVVRSGGTAFDQAASFALFRTRFTPGRLADGRAVAATVEYRYLFKGQAGPAR